MQAVTEDKAFFRPTSAPVVFFFAEGSGSWCALPWLDNVPLDTCTVVEASDECEASTQQKGLSLNAHTAEGFSCRNLG